MNDKQKQIEEMAKVISPYYDFCKVTRCEDCNRKKLSKCRYYSFAKRCVMNGYRKQSDTAKEILQKLIYNITANNTNDGYLSESIDYSSTIDDIKELAAQYGVEVKE